MTLKKCPDCKKEKCVIKNGLRSTKKGNIQRYYCTECNLSFSGSGVHKTEYPENVILYTLEMYNRGYPVSEVKKLTGKRYRYSPPRSTIYTWIDRYRDKLTFLKLRKNYNIDPENLTTTQYFHHQAGNKFPPAHKSRFVHNRSTRSHTTI